MKMKNCYKYKQLDALLENKGGNRMSDLYDTFFNFLNMLKPDKALVLNHLIFAESASRIRLREDEDYFLCSNDYLLARMVMPYSKDPDQTLNRLIKELKKDGFIDTKIKNTQTGRSRFVKLNETALDNLKAEYSKILEERQGGDSITVEIECDETPFPFKLND